MTTTQTEPLHLHALLKMQQALLRAMRERHKGAAPRAEPDRGRYRDRDTCSARLH